MKKFQSNNMQKLSRETQRGIRGGFGCGCSDFYLSAGDGSRVCAFPGPNGQICQGLESGGQCCA